MFNVLSLFVAEPSTKIKRFLISLKNARPICPRRPPVLGSHPKPMTPNILPEPSCHTDNRLPGRLKLKTEEKEPKPRTSGCWAGLAHPAFSFRSSFTSFTQKKNMHSTPHMHISCVICMSYKSCIYLFLISFIMYTT